MGEPAALEGVLPRGAELDLNCTPHQRWRASANMLPVATLGHGAADDRQRHQIIHGASQLLRDPARAIVHAELKRRFEPLYLPLDGTPSEAPHARAESDPTCEAETQAEVLSFLGTAPCWTRERPRFT